MLSGPITLIKKSLHIFFDKSNLPVFIKIYLPLLPFAIFSIWQETNIRTFDDMRSSGLIWFVIVINAVYLVVYIWSLIVSINVIRKRLNNESVEIMTEYRLANKMIPRFMIMSLLISLIQLGGVILLIIPGIIFAVWYSFAKFAFVEENTGITASLRRSHALVKGKFWKVLGREFVFVLFMGGVGIILSIIPFGIGSVVTTIFGVLLTLPFYLLYRELVLPGKSQ